MRPTLLIVAAAKAAKVFHYKVAIQTAIGLNDHDRRRLIQQVHFNVEVRTSAGKKDYGELRLDQFKIKKLYGPVKHDWIMIASNASFVEMEMDFNHLKLPAIITNETLLFHVNDTSITKNLKREVLSQV